MSKSHIRFENDVKEYGIQTDNLTGSDFNSFENDVKEYGIQTTEIISTADDSLRMM